MDDFLRTVALWRQRSITTNAELAAALRKFRIEFAYQSGKINDADTTYEDTRAVFTRERAYGFECDVLTLFDIRNARDAYEVFLKAFGEKRQLDQQLLEDFQMRLTQHTYDPVRMKAGEQPGRFRKSDGPVDEARIGSEAETIAVSLAGLIDETNKKHASDPLAAAAMFSAEFLRILPFGDGNGRTARIACNYLLVLANYPPVVFTEEDLTALYDVEAAWDENKEIKPLIDLIKELTVRTWCPAGTEAAKPGDVI